MNYFNCFRSCTHLSSRFLMKTRSPKPRSNPALVQAQLRKLCPFSILPPIWFQRTELGVKLKSNCFLICSFSAMCQYSTTSSIKVILHSCIISYKVKNYCFCILQNCQCVCIKLLCFYTILFIYFYMYLAYIVTLHLIYS